MTTATPQPSFKTCPECAEQIRSEAIKCRFCGYQYEPEIPPMPAETIALLEAKVHRGECPTVYEQQALGREELRLGRLIVAALRQRLIPAQQAEEADIGRKLTDEELHVLYASDPALAATAAECDHAQELSARLSPISLRSMQLNLVRVAGEAARAQQSVERSHAGLFAVSPLAWAIKKTWDGKPRRR